MKLSLKKQQETFSAGFNRTDRYVHFEQKVVRETFSKKTIIGIILSILVVVIVPALMTASFFSLLDPSQLKRLETVPPNHITQFFVACGKIISTYLSETIRTIIVFVGPLAIIFLLIVICYIAFARKKDNKVF